MVHRKAEEGAIAALSQLTTTPRGAAYGVGFCCGFPAQDTSTTGGAPVSYTGGCGFEPRGTYFRSGIAQWQSSGLISRWHRFEPCCRYARLAQTVAQLCYRQSVPGSSPGSCTTATTSPVSVVEAYMVLSQTAGVRSSHGVPGNVTRRTLIAR